jgi:aspartate/methionine/tyrosine aminotransferase
MKFASRTNYWAMSSNKLDLAHAQLPLGAKIFDLTQSNPTQAGIIYPQKLLSALNDTHGLIYQPESFGLLPTRQAIEAYYAKAGYVVNSQQILLTSSTSESYSFLMRLLINPYEKVLIPRPSYPLFSYLLDINDVAYDYYGIDQQGAIDREGLLKLLDPTVKAIMVVSPNNPTGQGISISDKQWLLELIHQKGMALIVDEVFADYAWGSECFERFVDSQQGLVFVLNGLSKVVALPQMKLGWMVVCGDDALVKPAMQRLEIIADTYLSVNTPVQWAAIEWLKNKDAIQNEIKKRVARNLAYVDAHLPVAIRRVQAQGGWYVMLKIQQHLQDEDVALQLLTQQQVIVYPGYFFDMPDEQTLVVSLLTEEAIFQEGIRRLCQGISLG